jgi:hypothetical protein
MRDYLKEIFQPLFFLFFYNSWKMEETSTFKTTSFKQGKKD